MFTRMVLLTLWMVLTVGAVGAQSDEGSIVREEFQSETLGRTYQYNLYLPPGYAESSAAYPVIYLLHGRGDTMDGWLEAQETLDSLIASGDVPPLIAVMPDMPSNERAGYYVDSQFSGFLFQGESVETAFFADLIPHIDSTYRTIAQREGRFIGGYSMGGYGALRYALAHPDRFAGALVLSPAVYTPLPPADSSTREFGAFGRDDVLFDEEIYRRLNYPALLDSFSDSGLSMQFFVAVGDDEYKHPNPEDQLHDLDVEAHLFFNQIVRLPTVTADFRVYDGGHDWSVWNPALIEGLPLLTRHLP